MQNIIETHPWPPFLPEGTRILLLGSFPPPEKRWSMPFFYPNIQNDFWRIMGWIFYKNREFFLKPDGDRSPRSSRGFDQEKCERFLTEQKIGVYDIAKKIIRRQGNASDTELEIVEPVDLIQLLDRIPDCQSVAATGQKSLNTIVDLLKSQNPDLRVPPLGEYRRFQVNGRNMKLFRLPSTSRAYPKPIEEKANYYRTALALLADDFEE